MQSRLSVEHTAVATAATKTAPGRKLSKAGGAGRGQLDISAVEEDKRLWGQTLLTGPKWTKYAPLPFGLLRVLDLEEAAFLTFLVQWSWWKVGPEVLARNECWFYCPEATLAREIPQLAPKARRRLFVALKGHGFVKVVRKKGRRQIRIQFAAVAQAVALSE